MSESRMSESPSALARPIETGKNESAVGIVAELDGPSRRSRRAIILALLVGLPSSALFLWLSIRDADLDAVWAAIGDLRPAWIPLALGCLAVMYWCQAIRWKRIARAELPTRSVFGMLIAGLAVNYVVPARAGDLLRARWMSQATDTTGGKGLSTVVLDRSGDLLVLAVLLLACVPVVTRAAWIDRIAIGGAVVAGLVVVTIAVARLYARRRPCGRRSHRSLVRRLVRDTLDGLSEPVQARDAGIVLLLSLAAWVSWSAAAILASRSLGIELSPVEALFLAGIVNLGVAIPSSPGFVGTYHWLVVSTLALYGIDRELALAFAVVFQACWYLPTTVGGGLLLVHRAHARVAKQDALREDARAGAHA